MKPLTQIMITLLITLISNHSFSQDRIILNSGDTLNFSITKETRNYLYFEQDANGVSTKGRVEKENIHDWTYQKDLNTLQQQHVEQDNIRAGAIVKSGSFELHKFRASLNGGLGYLLGDTKAPEEDMQSMGVSKQIAEDYYSQFKMGAQIKASLYYHLVKDYWIGAVYNGFYSNAEIKTMMRMDDVYMYYGKFNERYFVNFAGASFYSESRYGKHKQIGLNSSFAMGPAFYRDEAEMFNEQVLLKGKTLGWNVTLGFQYFIQPNLSLSIEPALFAAKVKKMTMEMVNGSQDIELDSDNYENLSRFDVSFGVVFYW